MAPLVNLRQVSLARGAKIVLRELNWSIQAGEFWVILGQNGVGKSTLLQALIGLHPLQSGTITLNGQSIAALSKIALAQKIGWLAQFHAVLLPCSVQAYLYYAGEPQRQYQGPPSDADLTAIDAIINACEIRHLLPKLVTQLSGGEWRRVEIAALLVQAPQLYLLDEPDNHLDMKYQIHLLNLVQQSLGQHHAAIMSCQDINLAARYATHVMLWYPDGRIECGLASSLLRAESLSSVYDYPIQHFVTKEQICWHPGYEHLTK